MEERAAVRGDHPGLFQGKGGEGGAGGRAVGDPGAKGLDCGSGASRVVVVSSRSRAVRVIASSVSGGVGTGLPRAWHGVPEMA
ncbi:hypothetical protein GCM10010270_68040 [Streptomyces violaceus]|nr:hypothetical protein GCM10010270_68040 [Streptomyces janthinus]